MAEEGKDNSSESSWWGSWINSAKSKTSTVFEAVKKDLDELSSAMSTQASNVGAALESTLKFNEEASPVGTVKKSLSSFFGQVTEALIPSIDDDDVETVLITRDGAITLTGFQKHLSDLQKNDTTYLEEPNKELQDKYKLWMEVIEQDQFTQDRLAKHLASSEILNEKYLLLVPDKITHMDFWQRYLFKRALLEDAIANSEIAERRAKNELNSTKSISPRKNIIQTEQPKLACNENDIINDEQNINEFHSEIEENENDNYCDANDDYDDAEIADELKKQHIIDSNAENLENELLGENIQWDNDEVPNSVGLSEEEVVKLFEQYEQEIQEREKKIKKISNAKKANSNNVLLKSGKTAQKNTNSNNSRKSPVVVESTATTSTNNKDMDNLIVQKDHFNNKDNKDETTSSTSDESWEKDIFD